MDFIGEIAPFIGAGGGVSILAVIFWGLRGFFSEWRAFRKEEREALAAQSKLFSDRIEHLEKIVIDQTSTISKLSERVGRLQRVITRLAKKYDIPPSETEDSEGEDV